MSAALLIIGALVVVSLVAAIAGGHLLAARGSDVDGPFDEERHEANRIAAELADQHRPGDRHA